MNRDRDGDKEMKGREEAILHSYAEGLISAEDLMILQKAKVETGRERDGSY